MLPIQSHGAPVKLRDDHAGALQVHDFAQTLKECDKQIKQLETASTGKLRPKLGLWWFQ